MLRLEAFLLRRGRRSRNEQIDQPDSDKCALGERRAEVREDLFQDLWDFLWIEVQLSESAQLHQGLDIALQVGGLNEPGLARKDKDFDLSVQ